MSDLAPCPSCKRHVAVDEITCPFCAVALPPLRAQRFTPKSLTRAAIFGAAIAACSDPKPTQPPPKDPGSAAVAPTPADAAPDAQVAEVADAAVPDDASVPIDAGAPVDAGVKKKPKPRAKPVPIPHPIPKPYGAPPARRRLV